MKIRVETYDGYRAGERPLRFHIGAKKHDVVDILDRWFGEDHDYFKVIADDGGVYVLRYNRCEDGWELAQYRASGAGQESVKEGQAGPKDLLN